MLDWLARWENWPFVLAFLVGLGLVAVAVLGVAKDLHHGAELDGAPDGHLDGDLHGGDLDHPVGGLGDWLGWLAVLGVGRAPLSVLLQVGLVSFGGAGLLVNAVGRDLLGESGRLLFPVALVAGAAAAVGSLRLAAAVFARVAPTDQPTARRSGEFVGQLGAAASLVTARIGQVRVEPDEPSAPAALLNAAVDPDWAHDIERGTEVLLVAYAADRGLYLVRPAPTD